MSHFVKIGEASLVMVVCGSTTIPFRVDDSLVPWLRRFTWHVTDSRRPESLPAVVRKRDPRTGVGKTLRMPVVVKVLTNLPDNESRSMVCDNFSMLVDLCKSAVTMKKPLNGQPLDCRFDNWCRPLTTIDRTYRGDDDNDPLLLQGPEVLSPPKGLDEDLVEILTGRASQPHKELTTLSHATLSVEQILAIARGDFPSSSPTNQANVA